MRLNAMFSRFRRWWSKSALFVMAISMLSSTAALCGFDEGVASYKAGNYTDAFKQWVEAAQHGDVDAQYNLGCLYARGEGVAQNKAWATDWLQRAADNGDLDAATWLLFANEITEERRKEFFSMKPKPTDRFRLTFAVQLADGRLHRRPCTTDEKDGGKIAFSLGVLYEAGKAGFPQDDAQAAAWYRKASDRNVAEAQSKLAYLYGAGRGLEQNQIEAARLFRRAAEQGEGIALANLAAIYASGSNGHKKDPVLAYVLLSHAADTGKQLALDAMPHITALLSSDQLMEGRRLAENWKANTPLPSEIAERLGPLD